MRILPIPLALSFAVLAAAQEDAPIGIMRGDLVAWAGTQRTGELTFRNAEDRLYQCAYDDKTYFERDNQRISVAATQKGDRVEILSDRRLGSDACYARTVQIVDIRPVHIVAGVRPRLRAARGATELFAPRGDITLAGVVLDLRPDGLVLRTRAGERKTILLRADTRFVSQGQAAERGALAAGTRVFIRAGRNLDGEVEAYQVVWGDILQP